MTRSRLAVLFAAVLLSTPAAAQIVVVPLDPVDPGASVPDYGTDNGSIVTIPLDPVNPGEIVPLNPVEDGDPILLEPRPPGSVVGDDVTTVQEDEVSLGTGAILKGLDKLAGTVEDLTLKSGETTTLGWLTVSLGECRYPVDNPSGDAYAWLSVREEGNQTPIFEGWMVASSPALNALDHSRFDVWVSHCTTD